MINEQIRCKRKALRMELDKALIAVQSQQVADCLVQSEVYNIANHIAYYLPVRGEVDARLVIPLSVGKQFYLPIIRGDKRLDFAKVDTTTEYKKNRFGILEPVDAELIHSVKQLDMVITPLVAYDDRGNRLGMGGGYYDRTFAYKKNQNFKPLLIGYAYQFQHAENIQVQDWDVKLDGVVTEKGFSLF